jgi:protein ImuB
MRRVLYVFLSDWPIDRLRRSGSIPALSFAATPGEETPLATVIATVGRRLLAAVNPTAAAAGLAPGMPLADALSFLPGLATADADPVQDAAALTRLTEWCGRYSPWTAPDGANGIKIEITGCAHLWGGEAALAADLAQRLARQRIAHRIAVAGTLGAAWALARFAAGPDAPILPPAGGEREALAPLPVEALRLDPATAQGLRRVGLRRIGELYPMPRDALARRFGDSVARRLDQALDDLPEPLSPLGETPTRRVRLSFAELIADPADLARAIERLAEGLTGWLEREGTGARRLDLAFHRVDGRVEHIRLGTARPNRDPDHLARLMTAQLDTVEAGGDPGTDPGCGIEDMILAAHAVEPLAAEQLRLLNPLPSTGGEGRVKGASAPEAGASLAPLLDRLGARFGPDAISRLEACESHTPERASVEMSVGLAADKGAHRQPKPPPQPSPACGGGSDPARRAGRVGAPGAQHPCVKPPRPVRLFRPAEPVEAIWLVPDNPPSHFIWRRRGHRIACADGPERIAAEWWTEAGAAALTAIRDYYRVEDEEGRRFWLFRAGLAGHEPAPRWFVHGIFA